VSRSSWYETISLCMKNAELMIFKYPSCLRIDMVRLSASKPDKKLHFSLHPFDHPSSSPLLASSKAPLVFEAR